MTEEQAAVLIELQTKTLQVLGALAALAYRAECLQKVAAAAIKVAGKGILTDEALSLLDAVSE